MTRIEEPGRQLDFLQECLSSDKRPLGLFLGAGCPMAVDGAGDDKIPLIPGIEGITDLVRGYLAECEDCGPLLKIVEGHF